MFQDLDSNNPAARLYALCLDFKRRKPTEQLRSAWGQILKIPSSDLPCLFRRIGIALSLIDTTRAAIRNVPQIDHELHLLWEVGITKAFSVLDLSDDGRVDRVQLYLDDSSLLSLRYCNDVLSRVSPEPILEQAEIQNFLSDIRALLERAANADLPEELRLFVCDKLYDLYRALELYPLTGTNPIRDTIDKIVGGSVLQGKDMRGVLRESEIGSEFWEICGKLAVAIEIIQTGYSLIEYFGSFERLS